MNAGRARYVWDYDISQDEFDAILEGRLTKGHLDRDWASVRLIEWAPYKEMIRILGFPTLIANWPRWRGQLRSEQQRQALDFLVEWLPNHHPELVYRQEHNEQSGE